MTALEARVVHRVGALELDLAFDAADDEIVAIVGPNGAGKTTLLRILAGLRALDDGVLTLDGTVLDQPATDTFVPPERRPIGVVFEDGLLFAHLSARENVAFGLRARGTKKRVARAQADELLARVGLTDHADARPSELSGGQIQRVALVRALAISPRVLLLDEPLASLDAAARIDMRRVLREHLTTYAGVRLLVTHDPVEALTLADRVIVVERGTIVQSGPPAELRAHPRSGYVAQLLGINLVSGELDDKQRLQLGGGTALEVAAHEPVPAGPVLAVIEPNAVTLAIDQPASSARNTWATTVVDLDHEPGRVRVRLGEPVPLLADVTPGAVDQLALRPGAPVWVAVKATAIDVSPR
jgi:molybdate transport system ATP-binding protein